MEEYTCGECGWQGLFCNYDDGPVCPTCGAELEPSSCSSCSCDGSCSDCECGD